MLTISLLLSGLALLVDVAPSLAQSATSPTTSTQERAADSAQQPPGPPQGRQGGGAAPSDDAFEMGSPPGLPDGTSEEQMWPAATAEGWARPCLVRWQRSFDDALQVARARHMPILVAVNMDGEIASEHFAGVRYRDPQTAALLSGYACVVASVYRHTPRDYDAEGRRVECPRFGTVTCGEHIEAERELYETYFDGRRVAPRHLVLDLDGKETYDVYFSWDTATVLTTFRKGREGWPEPLEPPERTTLDLTRSSDVADREALEKAYAEGDVATRRAILTTLAEHHVVDQVEVLRAAIFGFDLELSDLARKALAQCETEGALDLMAETLKDPLAPPQRKLLLDAVARLAQTSPRARTLASLHSGLSLRSQLVEPRDPGLLAQEYERSASRAPDLQARAEAAQAAPREPAALLSFAEAALERALEEPSQRFAGLLLEDARTAALNAERAGAAGPRLAAVRAVLAAEDGEREAARAQAVAAVEGGLLHLGEEAAAPREGDAWAAGQARTRLLRLFAEARERAIRAAYRAGDAWPPEWLSDVDAAYAALAADPRADVTPLVDYQDFLRWIGATPRADEVLDDALERFPDAPLVHERLRGRLLWEGGPERLEQGYAEQLARRAREDPGSNQLTWYAGYASLLAAEHHRRRGELEAAVASYERALDRYQRNLAQFPDGADSCAHYMALARAGLARIALERGDLARATDELLAGLRQRPDSAASLDGLGFSSVMTARMLQARLRESGDAGRAAQVQGALDTLDPRLLEPPPSELPDTGRRGGRGRPREGGPGRPDGGR